MKKLVANTLFKLDIKRATFINQDIVVFPEIERMSFRIWKAEDPESFENHRKALSEFVESGCFNSIFE